MVTNYFKVSLRVILLISLLCAPAFGVKVIPHHRLRKSLHLNLRHSQWHPLFPPSRESLIRQNIEIDRLGLQRLHDNDLALAIERGDLVPLPLSSALRVDPKLDPNRRYCRPWTARFLTKISNDFYLRFHRSLQINSAVRTIQVQTKLRRYNRNAAPVEGITASSHLAGLTVDLERKQLSLVQIHWLEMRFVYYYALGWIEVEEEFHQLCFHIMVSDRFDRFDTPNVTTDLRYDSIK